MVPLVTANVPIVEIILAAAIFILAMIGLAGNTAVRPIPHMHKNSHRKLALILKFQFF